MDEVEVMDCEELTNSVQSNGESHKFEKNEIVVKAIVHNSDSYVENENSDPKELESEKVSDKDSKNNDEEVISEVINEVDGEVSDTPEAESVDKTDVNSLEIKETEINSNGTKEPESVEGSDHTSEIELTEKVDETATNDSRSANSKKADDLKKNGSASEETVAPALNTSDDIVVLDDDEKVGEATKENKDDDDIKEVTKDEDVEKDKAKEAGENQDTTETSKKKDESGKKKKGKTCVECGKKRKIEFRIHFQGKVHALCSEPCYKQFKEKQSAPKAPPPPEPAKEEPVQDSFCPECQKLIFPYQGFYPVVGDVKPLCSEECVRKYQENNSPPRKCAQCEKKVEDKSCHLTWETMVFCTDDCLSKYQSVLGSHCTCCHQPVQQASLGKYCVCFGSDIRQFCSGSCLDDFKKGLKVCTFCQTDLSAGSDGFLAPVGDKGQFKDFCSQACMERYETMNNLSKNAPEVQECSQCKKQGTFKIQVSHNGKKYFLCCDNCVAGLRCTLRKKDNVCSSCHSFFVCSSDKNGNTEADFKLKLDGLYKFFCSKTCMTTYVLSHRRITQCLFCKVKKYNFDMIEKADRSAVSQIFCSLNCMSLYRVNVNAGSVKSIRCDNCSKSSPAQYHLTMSDSSIRNFCSYNCVLSFQNQFTSVPALTTTSMTRQVTTPVQTLKTTPAVSAPVIANVVSLAQPRTGTPTLTKTLVPQTLVVRPRQPVAVFTTKPQVSTSTAVSPSTPLIGQPQTSQVVREVIVQPPAPKSVKNKTVWCKPIMQTKGVSAKTPACHKAVQTDDHPRPLIFPVPVPVYVPTPLHMFSRPVPCPVPFPVPIPIPVLIPSSKESHNQIMKHFRKFQETSRGASADFKKSIDDSSKSLSDIDKPSDEEQTVNDDCENGSTKSTKRAHSPPKNTEHKKAKLGDESSFGESRDTTDVEFESSSIPISSTDPSASFLQDSSPQHNTPFETPSFSFDDEEQPFLKVP